MDGTEVDLYEGLSVEGADAGTADGDLEDVYGDLFQPAHATHGGAADIMPAQCKFGFQDEEIKELKSSLQQRDELIRDLKQQLAKEQGKVSNLESERAVLVRNISCLYKTAVMELERKTGELKSLRNELDQSKRLSNGEPAKQLPPGSGAPAESPGGSGARVFSQHAPGSHQRDTKGGASQPHDQRRPGNHRHDHSSGGRSEQGGPGHSHRSEEAGHRGHRGGSHEPELRRYDAEHSRYKRKERPDEAELRRHEGEQQHKRNRGNEHSGHHNQHGSSHARHPSPPMW
mmetsp:Transcript_38116/g.84935  ORF Transcript_38116/g.84935 Transcript_38116/m.84935 type:complete len:287 (+) Transcript_38116:98-958(+)